MKSDNPKISVIVPVYNAEKYLRRCINSILNQTFTDFEVLLINDGSTDSSGVICDEYAKQDSRVRVFHKENGGVSSARNIGIKKCSGDWICFVDSDDYIDVNLLYYISEKSRDNFDMIYFGYSHYSSTKLKYCYNPLDYNNNTCYPSSSDFLFSNPKLSLWLYAYNLTILKRCNLFFSENISYAEDMEFLLKYIGVIQLIGVLDFIGYFYMENNQSAMSKPVTKVSLYDHIIVYNNICQFYDNLLLDKEYVYIYSLESITISYCNRLSNSGFSLYESISLLKQINRVYINRVKDKISYFRIYLRSLIGLSTYLIYLLVKKRIR